MPEIRLTGCTPEPLMNYLKALGVFRLVAEDKKNGDPAATLSWFGGAPRLYSKFDLDTLAGFFENDYRPTPVVVPWSGGDFFGVELSGNPGPFKDAPTARAIIEAFLATEAPRLADYRQTLRCVLAVMQDLGISTKSMIEGTSGRHRKAAFLTRLRSVLPDAVIPWVDAAAQLVDEGFSFNPLLGSGGGSDGNSHFSDNFMQNLWDCLPDFDTQRSKPSARPNVRHALFGEQAGVLTEKRTGALFDSGAVGGPNATQGLNRPALLNPWDFVLGLEGTLVFAGGVAKRLGTFSSEAPAFPFTVEMAAAGFGSAVRKEYGQREVWMPLWDRQLTYGEVTLLMREGRAQIGRRPARNGIDFARAVGSLGVSAGVESFIRYGFIRGRVGGENYYTAAALGRFHVHYDASLTLLEQIDPWLFRMRRACSDEDAPARYATALRRLDDSIIELTRSRREPSALQKVLLELGRIEQALATGPNFRTEGRLSPLAGLSAHWLNQADDGSPEFRLAASLAGIQSHGAVGPLRMFLEEVEVRKFVNWSPGSTSAVWSKQPLAVNLAAVFRRRQMEAFRSGQAGVPLDSPRPARLVDVIAFLNGETDDDKLHDLLWGLIVVDPCEYAPPEPGEDAIPFEFGVLRLLVQDHCFAPNGKYWNLSNEAEPNAKPDPDVFHVLASGRPDAVEQCVARAARRLNSGGLLVTGFRNRYQAGKPLSIMSRYRPERLLAAMLFPLHDHDLERIANSVLNSPESEE